MIFKIASSPHNHNLQTTSALMMLVIYATVPGILAQWYFFGWGNIIHITIASITVLLAEFFVLAVRNKNIKNELFDGSALLTGVLLGISLPALAPWWITVIGSLFAILVVKQLYGGLGHNPFNPAMAAYVMLLISFPIQMTLWQPPLELLLIDLTFKDSLSAILTGFSIDGYSSEQLRMHLDGYTMATPLDTLRTGLTSGRTLLESSNHIVFGDNFALGWEWMNLGFLLGGLFLIVKGAMDWRTPVTFLFTLFVLSLLSFTFQPDSNPSTLFYWFSGGTMLGAFFILTDPVSGATSIKGRVIFAALAAIIVFVIRKYGSYPDAVAFAVILCNMAAPLIDQYSRPRTYGHAGEQS
jgi:Na+-translocating ferredoxin:NAD+ oxidoreductase subunit D